MYITVKLMLKITSIIEDELLLYERSMKHEIYKIAGVFKKESKKFEFRFKYISNDISWSSKDIVLRKAKELFDRSLEQQKSIMSFSSIWHSSSYAINSEGTIVLELGTNRGREKLQIPFYVNNQQVERIKRGITRDMVIKKQGTKWIAYVCVEIIQVHMNGSNSMGIDLGIKVPAVASVSNGSVKFFGNGREIRYYQRSYRRKIQMMQKNKQYRKLRKFEHKLSHILKNFDHKISKQIIDYACKNDVGCIMMEKLTSMCKNFDIELYENIYLWSYRRLQTNIEYKAYLSGIKVLYVNPYNTSKICPACSSLNLARDRMYKCRNCGYHAHRDVVGAINILHALDS